MKTHPTCRPCRAQIRNNANYSPGWLPTWEDESGVKHYTVPRCLRILREGEKLLIQRVSTYVPLRYLKGGSHGSRGHVCSFPKEIQDFITELPRKKVEAIKVVRTSLTKDKEVEDKTFMIRKSIVLEALWWLKRHNKYYKDIIINKGNLDWMGPVEEAELPVTLVEREEEPIDEGLSGDKDKENEEVPSYGVISHDDKSDLPKRKDKATVDTIDGFEKSRASNTPKEHLKEKPGERQCTMKFPEVGSEAIDEYDDSLRIFCLAFPWLYPGGTGDWADVKSTEGLSVEEWAKKLLYFEDGRFAKDKIWCFYALNYANRRANMKQGNFYVKQFLGNDQPQSLEELQKRIEKGDDSWIDKICYFGNTVKGTSPYWRQRRDEIYSWIQYHILKKNGAPTVFLTLSCAEHYWPDIEDLLKERRKYEAETSEEPSASKLVNEYTLVIQEYFQKRVKNWLETVGKNVFNIKHHWLRFEFAPGRGQIHAHCLLILDNMSMQKEAHDAKIQANEIGAAFERDITDDIEEERAGIYQRWAETELCMTTAIPEVFDTTEYKPNLEDRNHPASTRLSACYENNLWEDGAKILLSMQNHKCTDYCLRKRKIL